MKYLGDEWFETYDYIENLSYDIKLFLAHKYFLIPKPSVEHSFLELKPQQNMLKCISQAYLSQAVFNTSNNPIARRRLLDILKKVGHPGIETDPSPTMRDNSQAIQ